MFNGKSPLPKIRPPGRLESNPLYLYLFPEIVQTNQIPALTPPPLNQISTLLQPVPIPTGLQPNYFNPVLPKSMHSHVYAISQN